MHRDDVVSGHPVDRDTGHHAAERIAEHTTDDSEHGELAGDAAPDLSWRRAHRPQQREVPTSTGDGQPDRARNDEQSDHDDGDARPEPEVSEVLLVTAGVDVLGVAPPVPGVDGCAGAGDRADPGGQSARRVLVGLHGDEVDLAGMPVQLGGFVVGEKIVDAPAGLPGGAAAMPVTVKGARSWPLRRS